MEITLAAAPRFRCHQFCRRAVYSSPQKLYNMVSAALRRRGHIAGAGSGVQALAMAL
jgi:hypothetical protein